jgi:hypothetical protein
VGESENQGAAVMPEQKIKTPFPPPAGPLVEGSNVPVKESTERWSDVTLEDGSVLRLKPTVLTAIRIENQYDQNGNPIYVLQSSLNMVVSEAPAHLRKSVAVPKGVN